MMSFTPDLQEAISAYADSAFFVVARSVSYSTVADHSKVDPAGQIGPGASVAVVAAILCRKVPTFDPSDTIPTSTMAIHPSAVT
jgi:hypothetical protein